MIGGMICPPVEAAASTAAAKSLSYPVFFIIGIVILPEPTVFATKLQEYIPARALEIPADFDNPPVVRPAMALAILIKNVRIFVFSRKEAKMIKRTINVEQTPI